MESRTHYHWRKDINKKVDYQMWFNRLVFMLLGMATALTIVIVAQYTRLTPLQQTIEQMSRTCEASSQVFDGNLELACGELIDRVEARGYEVMSKDGKFWAEYKPQVACGTINGVPVHNWVCKR